MFSPFVDGFMLLRTLSPLSLSLFLSQTPNTHLAWAGPLRPEPRQFASVFGRMLRPCELFLDCFFFRTEKEREKKVSFFAAFAAADVRPCRRRQATADEKAKSCHESPPRVLQLSCWRFFDLSLAQSGERDSRRPRLSQRRKKDREIKSVRGRRPRVDQLRRGEKGKKGTTQLAFSSSSSLVFIGSLICIRSLSLLALLSPSTLLLPSNSRRHQQRPPPRAS